MSLGWLDRISWMGREASTIRCPTPLWLVHFYRNLVHLFLRWICGRLPLSAPCFLKPRNAYILRKAGHLYFKWFLSVGVFKEVNHLLLAVQMIWSYSDGIKWCFLALTRYFSSRYYHFLSRSSFFFIYHVELFAHTWAIILETILNIGIHLFTKVMINFSLKAFAKGVQV